MRSDNAAGAPELLLCPFCGGMPRTESTITDASIWCESCKAKVVMKHYLGTNVDWDASPRVAAAWNRRADIAASPEVQKLIREAEARGMGRAAALSCSCGYDVPDNVTFDDAQMFRAGAETALDAVSAMLRAEAAAIREEPK